MPLLPFTYTPISQRVADRVFDGTTLCQVATWESIIVRVLAGELSLELKFNVAYHSLLATGLPGAPLPNGKGLAPWYQTLYANNECAVYLNPAWVPTAAQAQDPRNGEILYYHVVTSTSDTWQHQAVDGTITTLVGGLAGAPEPCLKQGDAFALSMDNPLALAQLIRYHLNAANLAPFLKFS